MINNIRVGDFVCNFSFPSAPKEGGGPLGLCNGSIIDNASFKIIRVTSGGLFKKGKEHEEDCTFRWIPWVPGKINYCPSQGVDVLSGWYSGCWMARYKETNWRVCHIATDSSPNMDCKQSWRDKKAEVGVTDVTEFLPHNATQKGDKKLGLVTSTGAFYGIGMQQTKLLLRNPWRDPEDWKQKFQHELNIQLTDLQAQVHAKKKKIESHNIYPGSAYRILEIAGPLDAEGFPQ